VRGSALAAHGLSDFVRFNRIEGLAFGFGVRGRLGSGLGLSIAGRYGVDDREAKGRVEVSWQNAFGRAIRVYGTRDFRDLGDVPERSLFVNSIASQEFGSDYTDPVSVDAVGGAFTFPARGVSWTLDAAYERHDALALRASPAHGRFEPPIPADSVRAIKVRLVADRPTRLWYGGIELRARAELRALQQVFRGSADIEGQREIGPTRLVARTLGALVSSNRPVPAQDLVFFGGPVTAPGYDYHTLVGDAAISQRVELQFPVPFPSVSLGRFGRSAARATLSPYVIAVALSQPGTVAIGAPVYLGALERIAGRKAGLYPSVGTGLLFFFDLVRVDVARGLRDGRWSVYVDVNRAFWSVL
jgi:hypothetical protein